MLEGNDMSEMRTDKRVIYDGDARIYLSDSMSLDAGICNISSGGMLIQISGDEINLLERVPIFASCSTMMVEFNLPSSEGQLLSADINFARTHSNDIYQATGTSYVQIGVYFIDREQPGCVAVQEYIDIFSIYND